MPLLVIVSVLFMGLAQAGHFHKQDADSHGKQPTCALCLHGNHVAAPPAMVHASVTYLVWVNLPPLAIAHRGGLSSAVYYARGPPRS
jgi:hypothetical protein